MPSSYSLTTWSFQTLSYSVNAGHAGRLVQSEVVCSQAKRAWGFRGGSVEVSALPAHSDLTIVTLNAHSRSGVCARRQRGRVERGWRATRSRRWRHIHRPARCMTKRPTHLRSQDALDARGPIDRRRRWREARSARRREFRPRDLALILHGTTVATNAVLEGKGARVGLLVTAGFEYTLHLAKSWTPGPLFGWIVMDKPDPLASLARHARGFRADRTRTARSSAPRRRDGDRRRSTTSAAPASRR